MLFVTPAVTAIVEALASAAASEGPIAVVGNAKLAAALAERREVIPVGLSARAAKRLPRAVGDTTSLAAGSLAAVVGTDVTADPGWIETLRAWTRVVRDGGALVLVDEPSRALLLAASERAHAAEASRRALCAGLSELEQRHAGRAVITSGLVSHLDR